MAGTEIGIAAARDRQVRPLDLGDVLVENANGSVEVSRWGTVDIFVQEMEESVSHSPDEARALAYDILAAVEFAEKVVIQSTAIMRPEGAVDGDQ